MAENVSFLGTGVGSMPFTDPEQAVDLSLKCLPDAPFWPQLPQLGLREQMEIQYSQGLPRAVIDYDKRRMFFDTAGDYSEDLAAFYENYLAAMDPDEGNGDCSAMAISEEFAAGLHAMLERLKKSGVKLPYLKVQTTGPCTMGLSLVDENKRAIYYNEEFRDVLVKAMAMKCRWQMQQFKPFADRVICFIDEPILSAFGSSTYVSVQRGDLVSMINEVVSAVHAEDGLAGVHCCGNTEWSILVDAGVDLINFDAFGYGESLAMYPAAVEAHLRRGGMLAWGIVPTSAAVRSETVESLADRMLSLIEHLCAKGIPKDLLQSQVVITPSCGTGSLSAEDAERVFSLIYPLCLKLAEQCGRK